MGASIANPMDRDAPKAETFCTNINAGMVKLTAAEWAKVKASTKKYAKLLG